jgi:hypothetical protein
LKKSYWKVDAATCSDKNSRDHQAFPEKIFTDETFLNGLDARGNILISDYNKKLKSPLRSPYANRTNAVWSDLYEDIKFFTDAGSTGESSPNLLVQKQEKSFLEFENENIFCSLKTPISLPYNKSSDADDINTRQADPTDNIFTIKMEDATMANLNFNTKKELFMGAKNLPSPESKDQGQATLLTVSMNIRESLFLMDYVQEMFENYSRNFLKTVKENSLLQDIFDY